MKFKKGDQVKVTAGKDRGKSGEISQVFPSKNKVLVKGVNLYKRHLKSREGVEGGIFSIERPLPTASIAIICPTCKKPTRVGYTQPEKGQKVRICKLCKAEIVLPKPATKTKKS